MQFWLQDEDANILDLDSTVQEISLGGNTRAFKVVEFAGAAGGRIRGTGNPGMKKFKVSRKEKAESGDKSAWNSRRNDYQKWLTMPSWKKIWLYIRDGEDSFTIRTEVYPEKLGEDAYKYIRITDNVKSFALVSPKGLFENIVATTGNEAIISDLEQTVNLDNDGMWETPAILKFTPTSAESIFDVRLSDEFGIRLGGSFPAGVLIEYNTADNTLEIGGVKVNLEQYRIGGGVFNIPPGNFDLFVTASGAGTFAYEWSERYS